MLKSVLYIVLLLTTGIRLADVIYLFASDSTNLPMVVLAVTSAVVLYGLVLALKKLISSIRIAQFMAFFIVQTVAFAFNMAYKAVNVPLELNGLEIVAVGTFLDILVNMVIIYFCIRQKRSRFMTVVAQ